MRPFDRAKKIADDVGRLIAENGGTSHHIAACSVTLPAHYFDEVWQAAHQPGGVPAVAVDCFSLHGVTFVRGMSEAEVRNGAAMMLKGLT